MKKLSYIFLLTILFSVVIISCNDESLENRDDMENPEVHDVSFGVALDDTIQIREKKSYQIEVEGELIEMFKDTLLATLNLDSFLTKLKEKDPDKTNILTIGKKILFNGRFTDDHGLSSAVIRIWGDTLREGKEIGIAYKFRIVPNFGLFQETEPAPIENFVIEDEIPSYITTRLPGQKEQLKVRESGENDEKYYFSVRCIDISGKEDSVSYDKVPMKILSRKTLVEEWKKGQEEK